LAEMAMIPPVLAAIGFFALGYAFGAIPFGVLFTRAAGLGDIRAIGSGNIGATNVLRTGRKGLALATLIADMGKGLLPVLIAWRIAPEHGAPFAAALGAFLGHLFPVTLGFKGGKGVATYSGTLAGLYWPAAAIFCGVWLCVAALTRYSSLAALIGAAAAPLALLAMGRSSLALFCAILSVLLIWRHRRNIRNLISGHESRIGQRAR
jgi:glycerol-3-phosphate acyltransferase PlsY